MAKKRKNPRIQVEPLDPWFIKTLARYQGDLLKNEHDRKGAGPAIYKLAAERLEQLYPELAKAAGG